MVRLSRNEEEERVELERVARFVQNHGRRPPEPQRIAEVLSRLLARRGYAQAEVARELADRWATAVGHVRAQDSRPGKFQRGVLEVIVRNSAMLQELTFQKSQLLRCLAAADDVGPPIRELRFRVGRLD
jgi:predicted nucleic acid-binding Zn ribbon protein